MKAKTTSSGRQTTARTTSRAARKSSALDTVGGLTKSLRSLAGQVVGMAGVAVDTSLAAATGLFPQGVASTKALVNIMLM